MAARGYISGSLVLRSRGAFKTKGGNAVVVVVVVVTIVVCVAGEKESCPTAVLGRSERCVSFPSSSSRDMTVWTVSSMR